MSGDTWLLATVPTHEIVVVPLEAAVVGDSTLTCPLCGEEDLVVREESDQVTGSDLNRAYCFSCGAWGSWEVQR